MSTVSDLEVHGDVKTFVVGTVPYRWLVLPASLPLPPGTDADPILTAAGFGTDPTLSGTGDLRLKGVLRGATWRIEAHHAISALPRLGQGLGGASTGVGLTAPELLPLTWEPDVGEAMTLRGRTDRLLFALHLSHLSITAGRQPVSFGSGLVFTPMDVVNPFSPATVDTEYKPGVDALRVDGFLGTAGQATLVAAWAGALPLTDPDAEPVSGQDLVVASHAQGTVGVTDLHGLLGYVRSDWVLGAGVVSALGPLGVHSDVTLTLPGPEAPEEEPFVRAVLGGEARPTPTTTVALEGYLQTWGAGAPERYLAQAQSPRVARGEIWLLGRGYGALSVLQEVSPLVQVSGALIANLADPSALLAPSLTWSVADEATVGLGGYLALGQRPEQTELQLDPSALVLVPPDPDTLGASVRSEFGLYPHALFLQMRAYF
jgi:hypothetical protein